MYHSETPLLHTEPNVHLEKGHEIFSCPCWTRFGVTVGDVDGSLHDLPASLLE